MKTRASFFAVLLLSLPCAIADTEVSVFTSHAEPSILILGSLTTTWQNATLSDRSFSLETEISFPSAIPGGSSGSAEQSTFVEKWVSVDLDSMISPVQTGSFMAKVSWPGNSMLEVKIDVFSLSSLNTLLNLESPAPDLDTLQPNSMTHRKYIRIQAENRGVRKATSTPTDIRIPFLVIIEPLYLGILPVSLVSTVVVILAAIMTAACLARPILHRLETIANQANSELRTLSQSRAKSL